MELQCFCLLGILWKYSSLYLSRLSDTFPSAEETEGGEWLRVDRQVLGMDGGQWSVCLDQRRLAAVCSWEWVEVSGCEMMEAR